MGCWHSASSSAWKTSSPTRASPTRRLTYAFGRQFFSASPCVWRRSVSELRNDSSGVSSALDRRAGRGHPDRGLRPVPARFCAVGSPSLESATAPVSSPRTCLKTPTSSASSKASPRPFASDSIRPCSRGFRPLSSGRPSAATITASAPISPPRFSSRRSWACGCRDGTRRSAPSKRPSRGPSRRRSGLAGGDGGKGIASQRLH